MLLLPLLACRGGDSSAAVLRPAADASLQVRLFAGEPLVDRGVVAGSFASLHAVEHEGALWVPGLDRAAVPTWWEEHFPSLFVQALVTTDLARWELRRWSVDAPGSSLLDPAMVEGPEGLELWFAAVPGLGDPAKGRKPTTIWRTRYDGRGFGRAEAWAEGRGLVDPSPVWWGGAWRVFATRDHQDVVEVTGDGVRTVLAGATVPFARDIGGRLVITAQAVVDGAMRPVEIESADGAGWSARRPVALPANPMRTCASPVRATVAGQGVLLCVDERRP